MLRRLLERLAKRRKKAETRESDPGQGAAHVEGKDAPHHHYKRRAVKDWHTNHWDLDFLSREELEALAERQQERDGKSGHGR